MLAHLRDSSWPSAAALRRAHAIATVAWLLMVPASRKLAPNVNHVKRRYERCRQERARDGV